jgi:ArsR family transcriptional regulator
VKVKAKKKLCCVTAADLAKQPVPDSQRDDELVAKLAWAIAHPARVRILRILLAREACICGELVGQFPLAQSTVSQHLKILKESGIVHAEIDGPKVCYCVNPAALAQLKRLVADL